MAIESHMNDPLLRSLMQLNAEVERSSAERRAAMEQATRNVTEGLLQRQKEAEDAEIQKLAVGMTGREGQDFAAAQGAKSPAASMARDSDGIRVHSEGGIEPGDLDDLAMREEEDTFGEQVGNRMSGKAVGEAALEQRKAGYRASEFEPFAGTEMQREKANLARASGQARTDVNNADALAEVYRLMSNGATSATSPTAPAPAAPAPSPLSAQLDAAMGQEIAKTMAAPSTAAAFDPSQAPPPALTPPQQFPAAARDPRRDAMLAELARAYGGGMPGGGPSTAGVPMAGGMAPGLAPPPPASPPPVDPGLAAYMATRGMR